MKVSHTQASQRVSPLRLVFALSTVGISFPHPAQKIMRRLNFPDSPKKHCGLRVVIGGCNQSRFSVVTIRLNSRKFGPSKNPGLLFPESPDYVFLRRQVDSRCKLVEKVGNKACPRCGQLQLNVYYSENADERVGAWCEYCNLKAYYYGEQLVEFG